MNLWVWLTRATHTHRDGKLRCVCVDSESKVINHNYREDTRSSGLYREGNMIAGQRGRGNNWALGYHGLSGETEETSLLHRAMETVRKEVERCDSYAGKRFNQKTSSVIILKSDWLTCGATRTNDDDDLSTWGQQVHIMPKCASFRHAIPVICHFRNQKQSEASRIS